MKYIVYECGLQGTLSGGLGDRILGMISGLFIAKVFNSEFLIKWHDMDIERYFNFDSFNYFKRSELLGTVFKFYNHNIDDLEKTFKEKDLSEVFSSDILILNTNQNIWQFLAENYRYKHIINMDNYEEKTREYYTALFTKYFKPSETINLAIDELIKGCSEKELVGIQLRFGDIFMACEKEQVSNPQIDYHPLGKDMNKVKSVLTSIVHENSDKKIFITSDISIYDFIETELKPINSDLIYYNKTPTHIERSKDKEGIDKTFIDFIALSKCTKLYITFLSNFGRSASFIGSSKKVIGIYTNTKSDIFLYEPSFIDSTCKNKIFKLID